MSSADERIINRLQKIYDAQGAGGASFEELTGEPTDNAALGSALSAKVPTSRTVNGHELSSNVTVSKGDVGLGNADNTSDANKPVSTAQQTAIDAKQNSLGYTPYGPGQTDVAVTDGGTGASTAGDARTNLGLGTAATQAIAAFDAAGAADAKVSDTAYDATSWNGVTDVAPSKNAVRDKIESMAHSGGVIGTADSVQTTGGGIVVPANLTGVLAGGTTFDSAVAGRMVVTFGVEQPDAAYVIGITVNDPSFFFTRIVTKQTTDFSFRTADITGGEGVGTVDIWIMRLSQ